MTSQLLPLSSINNFPEAYSKNSKSFERIDLLLLLIEAIEINGSETMLSIAKSNGLSDFFPNRVEFWKQRCNSSLRKVSRRGHLMDKQIEAFLILINAMSNRLYPQLRQLLSSKESSQINSLRWESLISRFASLIQERMNCKRSSVQAFLVPRQSYQLCRQNVLALALSSGPAGLDRLRASIQDTC